MKKVARSNSDVVHAWIHGELMYTHNRSFSTYGQEHDVHLNASVSKLYSYSTLIGIYTGDHVLLERQTISTTTAGHLSAASRALDHTPVGRVMYITDLNSQKPFDWCRNCLVDAASMYDKSIRARKYTQFYLDKAGKLILSIENIFKMVGSDLLRAHAKERDVVLEEWQKDLNALAAKVKMAIT